MNPIQLAEIRRISEWLRGMCGDDADLFADMTEGESPVFDVIGTLHEARASALELVAGIKEREADLKVRRDRLQARADNMKSAIGQVLRAAQIFKAELPEATYSVRDGKAKLVVVDGDAVPDEYRRIKSEPDKTAINEAFDDASALPNWLAREAATDIVTERRK